jgi:hypothetical protein
VSVIGIALREVRERRFLLAAAAVCSLLALALQMLPATHEFGEMVALWLLAAFTPGVALAVGSSLVGRDLARGQLSFYFSRPLTAGALWAGKFLGGTVLVLGAFLCSYAGEAFLGNQFGLDGLAAWLVFLLGFMATAHVLTAMYRSGSKLFVLDLALAATCVTVFGAQVRHLVTAGAGASLFWDPLGVIEVAMAMATVGMLAAAAAQLALGRADAHRGHVALSTATWTLTPLALGGLAVWSAWLLRVTPADLGGAGDPLVVAPRGHALIFRGASSQGRVGYNPVFLMNGQSGSYLRLPPERVGSPAFAPDGRTAAWVAPAVPWWAYVAPEHLRTSLRGGWASELPAGSTAGTALAVARLDRGTPVIEEHSLEGHEKTRMVLAMDEGAHRVLLSDAASVSLHDIDSGRDLGRAPFTDIMAAEFLPDGAVRLYRKETIGPARAIVVMDWSVKDDSRIERARVSGEMPLVLLARRGDLSVISQNGHQRAVLDAGRGAVREFDSAVADLPGVALVLSTGQVAMSLGDEVRIVARGGGTVASVPIEPRARVYALREPTAGQLAIGLWTLSFEEPRTLFVDAATGVVRGEEKGLLPAGPRYAGTGPPPEAGSFASRLFTDQGGALFAIDPDGRRRVIVSAGE